MRSGLAIVGTIVVVVFALAGLVGPCLAPYDPNAMDPHEYLTAWSPAHPLGTDAQGRDVLSRLLFGARMSLLIGLGSVGMSFVVGTAIGLLSGYYSRLGTYFMRVMDVWLSLPSMLVALIVVSVLGVGLDKLVVAIAFGQIPQFARVAYSFALPLRQKEFVEAAYAMGASGWRIIFRHIFPNLLAPLVIQASLLFPGAIMLGSSLSFLGLGVQPPHAEWGAMIASARKFVHTAPFLMLYPGLALALVVLGFNLMGDALRDALDPKRVP